MPELRIYGLAPDQLEHVIAHHAMAEPACEFEGFQRDTVGRWRRDGWHELICWRVWIADPESVCVCPDRAAR